MVKKRTYSQAFKVQALALAKTSQKSISEIERDLGITPGLLHKWKGRMKVDGSQAFPGKGHQKQDEELIRRLKREVEVLRQEREILKSVGDLLEQPGEVYQFMNTHRPEFRVAALCRAFGVSRSAYYVWLAQGGASQQACADAVLTEQIRTIFEESGQTYGSRRMYAELKARSASCSRRRVARLMRQAGLNATAPRRQVHTTQADGQERSVQNLLAPDFTADAPNHKWLVDITGIWTNEGWLYLAGVLDLFSRRLIGWAMDEHMPDELTQEALEMAILQRQPPAELLHHADQGSQYTSDQYQALLAKHHMLASFSGVGCCYDNAPMV